MVAAAPFANVVEQRRQVQHPGLVPAAGQQRAKRILVRVFGHEKAPHIAQHHEDVLIYRIGVEQVVLHLPDDAPKWPQVAPEHRSLVHQAQGAREAFGLAQDVHEQAPVVGIMAKRRVHQMARVVQRPQRAYRKLAQAPRGGVEPKGFHDGLGLALVEVVADHFDLPAHVKKARVQRAQFLARGGQAGRHALQQNLAQLGDGFGGPVVAAHQYLAGAQVRSPWLAVAAAVAQRFGHGGLQIEHQTVFTPPGQGVQAGANEQQQRLVAFDLAQLKSRGQAVVRQLAPTVAQACGTRHPQHGVQVAQPAGGLFAVGLERVGGVFVARVALVHLQRFGGEKSRHVQVRAVGVAQFGKEGGVAQNAPCFQQGGLHGDVGTRFLQAFGHGAHARTQLQPGIPAATDELAHSFALRFGRVLWQQHQHIHIGMRTQLRPAIPPYGHQGVGIAQLGALPQLLQQLVGEGRELLQQAPGAAQGASLGVGCHQGSFVLAKAFAQRGEGRHRGFQSEESEEKPALRPARQAQAALN